jgi:hypothetical protein
VLKIVAMPILHVILVLLAVGFVLWLINKYVPMQPTIKGILNVAIIILLIIWLLMVFGILDWLISVKV